MRAIKNLLAVLTISALAIGCSKESQTPGILFQLRSSSPRITVNRLMSGTLQWTSGYASSREIRFEAKKSGNDIAYRQEARVRIDLFAPLSPLSTVTVPPATYSDVEFEVEAAPANNEAAFLLNGQFTSNGATTPVVFRIDVPIRIETKKNDFTLAANASYTAVTTLDLALLATGITESMLNNATLTNGTLVISSTSNTTLYNIMYDRLRNCGGIEIR